MTGLVSIYWFYPTWSLWWPIWCHEERFHCRNFGVNLPAGNTESLLQGKTPRWGLKFAWRWLDGALWEITFSFLELSQGLLRLLFTDTELQQPPQPQLQPQPQPSTLPWSPPSFIVVFMVVSVVQSVVFGTPKPNRLLHLCFTFIIFRLVQNRKERKKKKSISMQMIPKSTFELILALFHISNF